MDKWRNVVLRAEKSASLGIRAYEAAYEAMTETGRKHVAASEIFDRLYCHPVVRDYMRALGTRLSSEDIERSLIRENLTKRLTVIRYGDEVLLRPVPLLDYVNRAKRIIQEVEEIDEQSP